MATELELKLLSSFLYVNCPLVKFPGGHAIPSIETGNGVKVKGLISVAKHLTRGSTRKDLLGGSGEESALVNQWLEYRILSVDRCTNDKDVQNVLKELNGFLLDKAYLVGNRLTLADIMLYFGLHETFSNMTFYEKEQLLHLSRWFQQVQQTTGLSQELGKIFFQKNLIYTKGCSH